VAPVLEAHVQRAGDRFRGVRCSTAFSEAGLFGFPCDPRAREAMAQPQFHEGARVLADMGLSLDVWCVHTQLDELSALAAAVPELMIILDHIGTPESHGAYAGREAEARGEWASRINELARRPNVLIKLGGLGMDLAAPISGEVGAAS